MRNCILSGSPRSRKPINHVIYAFGLADARALTHTVWQINIHMQQKQAREPVMSCGSSSFLFFLFVNVLVGRGPIFAQYIPLASIVLHVFNDVCGMCGFFFVLAPHQSKRGNSNCHSPDLYKSIRVTTRKRFRCVVMRCRQYREKKHFKRRR